MEKEEEITEPILYDLHNAEQRIEVFKLIKALENCPDAIQKGESKNDNERI